jgi:hypothetical protein
MALAVDDDDPRTRYDCARCRDAKWELMSCPGGYARNCGRTDKTGFDDRYFFGTCRVPHTWTQRCACWERQNIAQRAAADTRRMLT